MDTNAALLLHLVGEYGFVVTIEVDEEFGVLAAERLADSANVKVVIGDGRLGHRERAPYDGVIVTAGAAEVAPAWVDQLLHGGRLVVPLTGPDRRGQCVTFERVADGLAERESMPCGFVPLR